MAKKEKNLQQKKITGKETFAKRRIICGIALIVVAVLLGVLILPAVSSKEKKDTYSIVMVNADIKEGTKITEENSEKLFITYNTTDPAFASVGITDISQAFEKYVTHDLYKNEYLKKADIADNLDVSSKDDVPEGQELVGLRVGSINESVGYLPKAGDIIRIYGVETERNTDDWGVSKYGRLEAKAASAKAFVYDTLSYVQIHSISDANGVNPTQSGAVPTSMVLSLNHTQTKQLIEAQTAGHIYLSLVSSGDEKIAKQLLKIQDRIIDEKLLEEELVDDFKRETISMSCALFDLKDTKTIPAIGDYLSFSYISESEHSEIGTDGIMQKVEKTEQIYPKIFAKVKVADIFTQYGHSILVKDEDHPNEDYKTNFKKSFLGLELTEYQAEQLLRICQNYDVKVEVLSAAAAKKIDADDVDAAIRLAQLEEAENEINNLRSSVENPDGTLKEFSDIDNTETSSETEEVETTPVPEETTN